MKIPESQIAVILQDCRTAFDKLPPEIRNGPGVALAVTELAVYSQKYGNFEWLKYHTVVYIGGRLTAATPKNVIQFRPKELAVAGEEQVDILNWCNKIVGQPAEAGLGWAKIRPTEDYDIKPVI